MKTIKKETIVCISSNYPPYIGGLERVAMELSEQLALNGNNVIVLTSDMDAKGVSKVEQKTNLLIKRLRSFRFAHTTFIPFLFWELLKIKKPAVFHLHLAQAYVPEMVWFVSKIRNIPYIVHFHLDVDPSGPLGFIFIFWKKYIQTLVMKGASKVITLSQDQTKLVRERYELAKDRVEFLSNGVSEKFFAIGDQERIFHSPSRLLFVGRLASQKRPERLIEAMSLLTTSVLLDVVGDGEDREKLEKLVHNLSLTNIIFHGIKQGDELIDFYKNADIFILPSEKEGMPLVLLEAMATGLPIIGSDVLGIHELIDGIGVLVENPNPTNFAHAIDNLLADKNKMSELSRKSAFHAKQYSWSNLADKLEIIYKELIR